MITEYHAQTDFEDEYSTPSGGRSAQKQLITVAIVTVAVLVAVLVLLFSLESLQKKNSLTKSQILTNGMVFDAVTDEAVIQNLGLTQPLTQANKGMALTAVSGPAAKEGCTAYRVRGCDSSALILLQTGETYSLYRFSYFKETGDHTGKDVLDVCGSGTTLEAIDCFGTRHTGGSSETYTKTITDATALDKFQSLFGALTPQQDNNTAMRLMQQSGSWDIIVTLRYANGLTYDLVIYKEANVAAGFRCVYELPKELLSLVE